MGVDTTVAVGTGVGIFVGVGTARGIGLGVGVGTEVAVGTEVGAFVCGRSGVLVIAKGLLVGVIWGVGTGFESELT